MRKNESGFTVVEGLLLVVLVAIIGFTGWYVYKQSQDNPSDKSESSSQQELGVREYVRQTSVPADWVLYEDKDTGISFSHPQSWKVSKDVVTKEKNPDRLPINDYSKNATEATSYCVQPLQAVEWCPFTFTVTNQKYEDSIEQYKALAPEVKVILWTIDGYSATEFSATTPIFTEDGEQQAGTETTTLYIIAANGKTYSFDGVYAEDSKVGGTEFIKAQESLTLFESLRID